MKTAKIGSQVSIQYEGMLEDGEIVERSEDTGPVEFELGLNIMPPAFEQAMIGMREGEQKTITMTPEEVSAEAIESIVATGITPSDSEGGETVIHPDININIVSS